RGPTRCNGQERDAGDAEASDERGRRAPTPTVSAAGGHDGPVRGQRVRHCDPGRRGQRIRHQRPRRTRGRRTVAAGRRDREHDRVRIADDEYATPDPAETGGECATPYETDHGVVPSRAGNPRQIEGAPPAGPAGPERRHGAYHAGRLPRERGKSRLGGPSPWNGRRRGAHDREGRREERRTGTARVEPTECPSA